MVSSSVMVTKEAFFFSSIHLAILTILTFFLKLVPLWSVVDLHCQVPHPPSASCRSRKRGAFLFCFFLSRKESFPSKPPADFLMSVFDRIRLLDCAPAWGKLVKQVSAIQPLEWEVSFSNKGWQRRSGC